MCSNVCSATEECLYDKAYCEYTCRAVNTGTNAVNGTGAVNETNAVNDTDALNETYSVNGTSAVQQTVKIWSLVLALLLCTLI